MSDFLIWLAGSPGLDPNAPGVRLQFEHEVSATVWVIIILGAIGAAVLSYGRLSAPMWGKLVGAGLRAGAIVLLALLLTGPKLVQVSERVEKDWVLGVVDRSASMGVRDAAVVGVVSSRDEQLRALLAGSAGTWKQVAEQRTLAWVGFDAGAYDLPAGAGSALPELAGPTGRASDVGGAIEAALSRASARPVSGVVLFSDGRSTLPVSPALVRRLAAERIGVYVVALGSNQPTGDVSVSGVDAPTSAFVGDVVPVQVKVQRTGTLSGDVRVQLVDEASGRVLDEQPVSMPDSGTPESGTAESIGRVTLSGTPDAGTGSVQRRWIVRIPPVAGELVDGNNEQAVTIGMVDRPLRLAFVDGYPRWEYRFLKNVLARERSLSFAATLLSPGRRYISEGAEEVFALPTTAAEWDKFDVIMIGDVQPGVFTPEQLAQIRTRVAVGGAGLVWIAGESAVPQAYAGTPLADLLPMVLSSDRVAPWEQDVVMRPTALADQLGVLRLADRQADGTFWPGEASNPASGWSRLRWAQKLMSERMKPAAEVLAVAQPVDALEPPTPLVVTMRYGAGRVVYIATDEVWRYRYGKGEQLVERFYLQLVRLLGRESVGRSGKAAVIGVSPSRAEVGTAVRVSIELVDQALTENAPATMTARLTRTGAEGDGARTDLTLRLDTGSGRKLYVGTWAPSQAGVYRAEALSTLLEGRDVRTTAEVFLPSDELRRPEADHEALIRLAKQTGGQVLTAETLATLNQTLPRREVKIVSPGQEQTLWDRPVWLVILLGLLGTEWVVRRLVRLT